MHMHPRLSLKLSLPHSYKKFTLQSTPGIWNMSRVCVCYACVCYACVCGVSAVCAYGVHTPRGTSVLRISASE